MNQPVYVAPNRKRIPYGMMNFADIRCDNYYYVDKTHFIPQIEEADRFFFFIRPRRFGKSLTLSVLQHYYDIRTRDKFDALFGDLYIGQHPTPDRNTYLVLYLNFSGISGELNDYRQGLDAHCGTTFENFCHKYADLLPPDTLEGLRAADGAINQLHFLYLACQRAGQRIYLFIDEYDHFTNAILSSPESLRRYTEKLPEENYLYHFLNQVKEGTYYSISRCFITGVTPMLLDDFAGGYNLSMNSSLLPEFNQLMGFTEEEVREMLTYYSTNSPFTHSVDELIELMKPWYDGYRFTEDSYDRTSVFNPTMVLHFLGEYTYKGNVPEDMIDSNCIMNSKKLCMLYGMDKEFAHDASVIQTLVCQGSISGDLKGGFPTADITLRDNFISLLYYFGMLTISGTHEGKTKLTIPNIVVQEQLYAYLLSTYDEVDLSFSSYEKSELSSRLAYRGDWQAYFDYIADCLKRYASQRDKQKGEFFVHGFTLAMTAQNRFYRPVSEQDTQAGYVDIFLCPLLENYPDMTHSYIVELKYAKYKDPEGRVEELRQEAIAQANRYAESETVKRAVGGTQLHKVVVVYKGMEMRVCEEVSLTNTIGGNPL